jgi:hypothetical protein
MKKIARAIQKRVFTRAQKHYLQTGRQADSSVKSLLLERVEGFIQNAAKYHILLAENLPAGVGCRLKRVVTWNFRRRSY